MSDEPNRPEPDPPPAPLSEDGGDEERVLPVGNRLRLVRGTAAIAIGSLIAFLVMAIVEQMRWGVPVAALGVLVATVGVLDLLGTFDDPDEVVVARVSVRELLVPLALVGGGGMAVWALVTAAVAGWLPVAVSAVAIPVSFLAAVVGVHGVGARLGVWDDASDDAAATATESQSIQRADGGDHTGSQRASIAALLTTIAEHARRVFGGADSATEQVARALTAARALRKTARGRVRPRRVGAQLPIHRRHGFWLVALATVLYLPMLGTHSLSDPWETHYGEVAREILARNDWISLWWAQDGWFWSKPILNFWIQALAMAAFGVRYQAGQMLSAAAEGRQPWPEWAVRMPIFLLTLAAVYLLYKAAAKVFGRRAGLLGGVALLTMPQWFFVAHQTMTDMPFVAPMAATMALFLIGVHTDPEERVPAYEVDLGFVRFRFSLYHLVFGAIIAAVLPQILYLCSKNLEIRLSPLTIRAHLDAFTSGSAGNCGIPGNEACKSWSPVVRGLHPAVQALIWVQALAILLYLNWGERRVARLCFHAAWFFAALSTMAKGPAGFGLPVLCALVYLVVTGRLRDLLRMEIPSGLLILATVALPWFVAMYARHGQPFTDRLLFHDMFKRAFTHVHDTNEGDDVSFRYYVWQLGYAVFPWTGLLPAALATWLRRPEAGNRRGDGAAFFLVWFLLAFALFTLMLTKFHHYILPAVPAAAVLIGVLLDDFLRTVRPAPGTAASMSPEDPGRRFDSVMLGAAAACGALLVALVGRDMAQDRDGLEGEARLLHLFTYNYKRVWPSSLEYSGVLWAVSAGAAALTLLLVVLHFRRPVVAALTALSVGFAFWGLDVFLVRASPHWGQRETVVAYVRAAREVPGPIVAYQMNWKGENFYAGNAIPAFVSSGKKFQDWILEQKKQGIKTFYFLTEHGRTGTLSNELGSPSVFDKLTTPELNNKFVLVRAVFE